MIIDQCPHCGASHVQAAQRHLENFEQGSNEIRWRVLRCQNPSCQRLILVSVDREEKVLAKYPASKHELNETVAIPESIREDFREAGLCLDAGCFKASMVMSRRVLQRCLKALGCDQNRLVDAIDHAVANTLLRPPFHPIATEIRHYGNLGAHPDDDQLEQASKENASTILNFCRLLIHDIFEVPAQVAALSQRRQD